MGKKKKYILPKLKKKERYKELVRKMAEANKKKNKSSMDDRSVEQRPTVESSFDLDFDNYLVPTNTITDTTNDTSVLAKKRHLTVKSLLDLDVSKLLDIKDTSTELKGKEKEGKRKIFNDSCPVQRKKRKHTPEELPYDTFFENNVELKDGGHRLIQINHFLNQLSDISSHNSLFQCSLSTMKLISEIKHGFISKFLFKCSMCKKEFEISNTNENLNYKAVEGTMVAGCGYAQLNQMTAALDLPVLSQYMYDKSHDEVCQDWEATAWEEMKKAGDEEREAAIKEGKVNKDGIALIDVIVDGCWCKRSYKTNYAALSGAAAIIGRRFGKVLFISVKNKYCCICARAEKKNETVQNHKCYKNYSGSSTGMEASIISEGFKRSIEMHQLIYSRFIADGDSSTYSKILETRPYADVTVEKIGCKNHILRNFCNKLQQLKVDTRYSVKDRKQISTEKILTARKYICDSINYHNENRGHDSVRKLHSDINIAVKHAFVNHKECNAKICQKDKTKEGCQDILNSNLWQKIRFLTANVASNSRSLIENVDSNVVECFNGIIAKFVGGKRVSYALKRSYQARCAGAVVSFNCKKITAVSKNIYKKSPSKRLKRLEDKNEKKGNTI